MKAPSCADVQGSGFGDASTWTAGMAPSPVTVRGQPCEIESGSDTVITCTVDTDVVPVDNSVVVTVGESGSEESMWWDLGRSLPYDGSVMTPAQIAAVECGSGSCEDVLVGVLSVTIKVRSGPETFDERNASIGNTPGLPPPG